MSRNFEEEYKAYLKQQAPDIWNRIDAGVEARIAEQAKSETTRSKKTEGGRKRKKRPSRRTRYLRFVGSVAACFVALALAMPVFRVVQSNRETPQNTEVTLENVELENATIINTEVTAEAEEAAQDFSAQTPLPSQTETTQTEETTVIAADDALKQDEQTDAGAAAQEQPSQAAHTEGGELPLGQYAAGQAAEGAADDAGGEGSLSDTATAIGMFRVSVTEMAAQADGSPVYTALVQESGAAAIAVGETIAFKLAGAEPLTVGSSYSISLYTDAGNGEYVAQLK